MYLKYRCTFFMMARGTFFLVMYWVTFISWSLQASSVSDRDDLLKALDDRVVLVKQGTHHTYNVGEDTA
jgi:hypothetical protein